MYVRAPKHFKAGKQFSFFFNSNFKKKIILSNKFNFNIVKTSANILYGSVCLFANINQPEITVSRITFVSKLYIKFIGWCYIFSTNN